MKHQSRRVAGKKLALLLGLLLMFGWMTWQMKAYVNTVLAQAGLADISRALESYMNDHNVYPEKVELLLDGPSAYLRQNYFQDIHAGYVYRYESSRYGYRVTAEPKSPRGTQPFVIVTGGEWEQMPY